MKRNAETRRGAEVVGVRREAEGQAFRPRDNPGIIRQPCYPTKRRRAARSPRRFAKLKALGGRVSVWSAMASAPLASGRRFSRFRWRVASTKAAVNAPHSRRSARLEAVQISRQRLGCGGFGAAFGRTKVQPSSQNCRACESGGELSKCFALIVRHSAFGLLSDFGDSEFGIQIGRLPV
jgi:hypothetical protein